MVTATSSIAALRASTPLRALTRKTLIERAAAQVAEYPQYNDHFRPCVLGVIKRDITTKMGLAFVAGEVVIVRLNTSGILGDRYHAAWSMRNGCDTSISTSDIEVA